MRLRILVLDDCELQRLVLQRLCPSETLLVWTNSFDEALRIVREDAPDAVVVSMPPAELPWREFQRLCASSEPAVPVLYESCVFETPGDAGLERAEGYLEFLKKPSPPPARREALRRLFSAAGVRRVPSAGLAATG